MRPAKKARLAAPEEGTAHALPLRIVCAHGQQVTESAKVLSGGTVLLCRHTEGLSDEFAVAF